VNVNACDRPLPPDIVKAANEAMALTGAANEELAG